MPNMSYCRFHNTLLDLRDCHEHIDDNDLSPSENEKRKQLIDLCREIADSYDEGDYPLNNDLGAKE